MPKLCDAITADKHLTKIYLRRNFDKPPVFFGSDPNGVRVRTHVGRGDRAVVVRKTPDGDAISLLAGSDILDVV